MCILFSYLAKETRSNEFKLILLSNRDEYHHRPSKPAGFVDHNIYGMDLTPGREGGTWLGISRRFPKLAVILNLDRPDDAPDESGKAGRGFMVPNFLNGNQGASEYAESLRVDIDKYNPFNLLLFEKNGGKDVWDVVLLDSFARNHRRPEEEFVSISNHSYDKPYPKTTYGQTIFKDIVANHNSIAKKDQLISSLIELGKNDAGLKADRSTMTEKEENEMIRNQVYVNIPFYSTRTHTVILVDGQDCVTYYEKTIEFPIDASNPVWLENKYEFKLD